MLVGGNGFVAAKIILFFRCATTALQEFSLHPGLSLFAHRIPPVGAPQIAYFSRISSPLPPLLQLSPAFLLTFSTRRGKCREHSVRRSLFFFQSPPFSSISSRVLRRASHSTPALCHSLHFSAPSAVGDRSETHKFHLLMHHILRRRCAFPLPLSQSPVISPHHAPLASSSRLLRFQNSPSTRPIPPHTSVFSDSFIHNYPLPPVINPTFPSLIGDTFARHDTKAHDSHNNSMPILPFFHSNSTFVV